VAAGLDASLGVGIALFVLFPESEIEWYANFLNAINSPGVSLVSPGVGSPL
jgi:hypothetical protein